MAREVREWRELLGRLHRVAQQAALAARAERDPSPPRRNPKGDRQRGFDRACDRALAEAVERELGAVVWVSEESGECVLGRGRPAFRVVVDPVDGSDNLARGLPYSAVSLAVLEPDAPLEVRAVVAALVGALEQSQPVVAVRGGGAWQGRRLLRTAPVARLEEALLSVELNHWNPSEAVGQLFARARGVRCYGCCSRALAALARGALDLHLDARARLTPESFLAAARAVEEAGGRVVGLEGSSLPPLRSLTERASLVAAATPELAKEVVDALHSR